VRSLGCIRNQKVALFPKFRENGWEAAAASALRAFLANSIREFVLYI
jgi:hypothetical protein